MVCRLAADDLAQRRLFMRGSRPLHKLRVETVEWDDSAHILGTLVTRAFRQFRGYAEIQPIRRSRRSTFSACCERAPGGVGVVRSAFFQNGGGRSAAARGAMWGATRGQRSIPGRSSRTPPFHLQCPSRHEGWQTAGECLGTAMCVL